MQPINVPSIDDGAPDELKQRAARLESLVKKRDARVAKRGESLQELLETPLETAGVLKGEHQWKEMNFDELAVELSLRRDVQALDSDHRAAILEMLREAAGAFERAKTEIQETLVAMGWHLPNGAPDPHALQPIFVLSHPSVYAARVRLDELQSKLHDRALDQVNKKEIAALESKITAARQRLATV